MTDKTGNNEDPRVADLVDTIQKYREETDKDGRRPGWVEPGHITSGWLMSRMGYGHNAAKSDIGKMIARGRLKPKRGVRIVNAHGIEMRVLGYELIRAEKEEENGKEPETAVS